MLNYGLFYVNLSLSKWLYLKRLGKHDPICGQIWLETNDIVEICLLNITLDAPLMQYQ